jgi:hypothetical protein
MTRPDHDLRQLIRSAALEVTGAGDAEVATLPGGASNRRYHRVTLAGGRVSSLVVMELPPDALGSEEVSTGGGVQELPFLNVQRFLRRGNLPVPQLYFNWSTRGLLFLEDFGDQSLGVEVTAAQEGPQLLWYRRAVELLVSIQAYAARHRDDGCVAFHRGFDRALLLWELHHFREYGLELGAGVTLSSTESAELERQFEYVADRLASEPRAFVHRDYQSSNLMIVPPERASVSLGLLDFQDALLGTRAYDLVGLLRDSYVELPPGVLAAAVDHFVEGTNDSASGEAPLIAAEFRSLFHLQTVQRKLKDAGRFVFIDRVKKNPRFLQFIPSSHRYVAQALSQLPELASLREILGTYLPELR